MSARACGAVREVVGLAGASPQSVRRFISPWCASGEIMTCSMPSFCAFTSTLISSASCANKVKSALRYPSFVIAAMVIAIVVVNIFVIPAFAGVFKGFNAQLPLMTRILMAFSDFMVNYWYVMAGGAVAAFFGSAAPGSVPVTAASPGTRPSSPHRRKIIQKATLARFSRSFALAFKSGVPQTQALSNVALTVDNVFVAKKIETMRETVERGKRFSSLRCQRHFHPRFAADDLRRRGVSDEQKSSCCGRRGKTKTETHGTPQEEAA